MKVLGFRSGLPLLVRFLLVCLLAATKVQASANLTTPVNGQQNVPANATFQWTTVSGAEGYELYVGTSQGAKDVVSTGVIQGTSYTVKKPLPAAAMLWARIWTELNGVWSYQSDISFTVSSASLMVYPPNGGQNVDTSVAFQWAPANNVQAYQLYVGTSPGASDLVNTGAIQATCWSVPPLPVGQTLYARIWSEINGTWTYSFDIQFTAALRFGYPSIRAVGIDPTVAFAWSPAYGGNGIYHLSVGTTPGANNLYDNTRIGQNSFSVPGNALPAGAVLYAGICVTAGDGVARTAYTVFTVSGTPDGDGVARTAYTVFTVSGTPDVPSQIVYPANGMKNADVSQPFQWTPTDIAQAYRLQISNQTSTVVDSGPITVPRYFAETLALGPYSGQLGTQIGGQWYWSSFAFTVTNTGPSMDNEIASALWATDYVRNMADFYKRAYSWTKLASAANPYGRLSTSVNCVDYSNALKTVLSETNVTARLSSSLEPQTVEIAFIEDGYEGHTLVEFWDSDLQRWMLLDPTFDLTVVRASDGSWATKEDMNAATVNQAWTSVTYQFLGAWGNSLVEAYPMDYPLMYLNVPPLMKPGQDPMPYLIQQPALPIHQPDLYYFRCSGSTTLVINGVLQQVACNQIDSLSTVYAANTIALPAGSTSTVKVYSLARNVFPTSQTANTSHLVSPANGQQNVPVNATFQWTTSSGAQAYYLYVGTTQGAKDVVDTGAIQGTSYTMTKSLPPGATLWARVWTELFGFWSYQGDITFTVSAVSGLTYPVNGQQNVPANTTFQWTTSPIAQAYYLYVGTTQGAKDVVNTRAIQGTSYTLKTPLPVAATLWARIWTELNGVWSYQGDISFTVSALSALTYPASGQQNVPANATFQWTASPAAQAYYLYVGRTQGANDIVSTAAIQGTSYTVTTPLPTGATLWARIWTKLNGVASYRGDISFTVSALSALTYPASGQQNVPANATFQWTTSPAAQAYYLYVGRTQGANDIVSTAAIQGTSYTVTTPLPTGATLWARIWTKLNGVANYQGDISFTVSALSALTYPASGQQNVPANATFQWTASPAAQAYYLYVGRTQGANDIVNTGAIQGTSYTVKTLLPTGATLWARIWTELNGAWSYQCDISFTVSALSALTYPASGQQNVPASATFQWTASPAAQAYYLYVGTSQGANDIVSTAAIQGTSYAVTTPLPTGATLWARIWTKLNGVASYQGDISFTVSALSHLTAPANSQQNVPANATFQWTASPAAQAYYLYVGRTQGANDIVSTAAIQGTSYTVTTPLPTGATLWARIWTKLNGVASYQGDISFTVSALSALTYPASGQQNVPANATFQWTTSPAAQAYYLYVGTSQGGTDVVNTGPIQGTSYTMTTILPIGATLWARIWTELNGVWSYQGDVSFIVSSASVMIYPAINGQNADTSVDFQWTPVNNVQAYRLYVGTSPGASDLVNTGAIQTTSVSVPPLPVGQTLYARIWIEVNGTWTYSFDTQFTAALRFGYPSVRAVGIDPTVAFTWSPAYGGSGYHLSVGTTPGANDLYDNSQIGQNTFAVPGNALPAGTILYASIGVRAGDGVPRTAYTVFTVAGTPVVPSQIVYPANGMTNADVSKPFQWSPTDMAQAYRLQISNGSSTVVDSGPITVPRYFAETLAVGPYTGQIGTEMGGQWYWTSFSFTVTNTGPSMDNEIASALWATDYVRHMADFNDRAYSWTKLASTADPGGRLSTSVICVDYANALLPVLSEMNVSARLSSSLQPQRINIWFIGDGSSTHTLVQFWDTDLQRWMLLDPTFDLTVTHASDGTWATMEDMNAATLNQAWTSITYQFLGAWGNAIAEAYYLDYPLLYLNISPVTDHPGQDPMPYLVQQSALPIDQTGTYYFQCSGSITLIINGVSQQVACNQIDSLSIVYGAQTIALPAGSNSNVEVYSPVRNAFPKPDFSVLTTPTNGQQNLPANTTFQWTTVSGAQAYYLYVGTTQGGKDVVNTGAIQGSSYTVTTPLPTGATLWARIWTELNGAWSYQDDVSFTVSGLSALTYPASGQQNMLANATFQWTTSSEAQAYYLYVGTSQGASDIASSGAIQKTSPTVTTPLPTGAMQRARIWTDTSDGWTSSATMFQTAGT